MLFRSDEARHGLLGQGSILALTSHAERTSPVLRGKWVLENLLGLQVPPPPPDVPPLKDREDGQKPRTMREQMTEHRANPVCAACHKTLDPIGFSLENFDAVVFDPPREGAAEQARSLALSSKVKRVVAVSCNPATFARDAALLIGGGYRLLSVTPVDQFLWSAHLELVGVFGR